MSGARTKGAQWKGSKGNLLGHYQNRTLLRVVAVVECPALSMTKFGGGRLHALMIMEGMDHLSKAFPGGVGGGGGNLGMGGEARGFEAHAN